MAQTTTPEKPPLYRSPSFTRLMLDEKRPHELPVWTPKPIEEPPSTSMIVGSLLFYLVAALVMVMVNKWVLNAIQVPLFFLLSQLVIAVVLLKLCAVAGFFNLPSLNYATCRGLAPLIACNCLGLAFNTYCLQYVDASFYQIARGLVLPFTVLFSNLLLRQRISRVTYAGIFLVCAGYVSGVMGERLTVSRLGVLLGMLSSVTTAIHAIVVKSSMGLVNNTIELVYLNNVLSVFVMLPMVALAGEVPSVLLMLDEGGEDLHTFTTGVLLTGAFGFLICVASFISIKVTSPVSHMISAAVRGVIQTWLGVLCFGDVLSPGRSSGIALILSGSALYTWSKALEGKHAVSRPEASLAGDQTPPPAYSSPARVPTSPMPTPAPVFRANVFDVEDEQTCDISMSDLEEDAERVY